jgi:FKBP-type peptidyl-prolyl cis-trans isomerase 2
VIQDGQKVSLRYTLSLDDGTVYDTNAGDEPLLYEHGAAQILPALEAHLAVQEVGAETEFTITAADGYGEIMPENRHPVPINEIPEGARKTGEMLTATDNDGNQRAVRVHEVREAEVVLDFNHPLAGQTLRFKVEVLGVE